MYYKVTYNLPKKPYKVIESGVEAQSKWEAIERTYTKNAEDFPDRELYKAKLLK